MKGLKFIKLLKSSKCQRLNLLVFESPPFQLFQSGTEKGLSGKIIGMMMSESFDVLNQGKRVPVLTIGGRTL